MTPPAEVEFIQRNCPACGFVFMVPKDFIERRRKDHQTHYCPAGGCRIWYPEDNKEEKLQKQVAVLEEKVQRAKNRQETLYRELEHEVRVRTGHQGHVAKLKNQLIG